MPESSHKDDSRRYREESGKNGPLSENEIRWKKELWEWTRSLSAALLVVFFLHHFVFNLSTVEGRSMQPTLLDEEWLFINRAVYIWSPPKRGDIVILKDPVHADGKAGFWSNASLPFPGTPWKFAAATCI